MVIRGRRLGVLAGSALACGGLLCAGWFWRHPGAFEPVPDGVSVSSDSWDGRTMYVAMTHDRLMTPHEVVTLHHVEANVVKNTAQARVEFYICVLDPGVGSVSSVLGDLIKQLCGTLEPVQESALEIGSDPMQQLIMAVTATQPGEVEIDGAAVTYSRGWQSGTQDVGEHIVLRTQS